MNRPYDIPEWMRPYLPLMGGRVEVERLMRTPAARVQINAPLALIQCNMEGKVALMTRLYEAGLLRPLTDTDVQDLTDERSRNK